MRVNKKYWIRFTFILKTPIFPLMKPWLDQLFLDFLTSSQKKKKLLYNLLPHLSMEALEKYLRLEVEGEENLPKTPALIVPHHSGFAGLDAMILAHEIPKHTSLKVKILTHKLWFALDALGKPAQKLGFIEASKENGIQALKKNNLVVLFPEGEIGNFKPSHKAYRVQEFKRGFIRIAFETGVPIIPTVLIGAEETHINLHQIKFKKIKLPIPLNVFPLPARWKIRFLKPIQLEHNPKLAEDKKLVHRTSLKVQKIIQKAIEKELKNRAGIFITRPPLLKKIIKKYTRL